MKRVKIYSLDYTPTLLVDGAEPITICPAACCILVGRALPMNLILLACNQPHSSLAMVCSHDTEGCNHDGKHRRCLFQHNIVIIFSDDHHMVWSQYSIPAITWSIFSKILPLGDSLPVRSKYGVYYRFAIYIDVEYNMTLNKIWMVKS